MRVSKPWVSFHFWVNNRSKEKITYFDWNLRGSNLFCTGPKYEIKPFNKFRDTWFSLINHKLNSTQIMTCKLNVAIPGVPSQRCVVKCVESVIVGNCDICTCFQEHREHVIPLLADGIMQRCVPLGVLQGEALSYTLFSMCCFANKCNAALYKSVHRDTA